MLRLLTIVHNGMPFLVHQLRIISRIKVDWTWDIVEGIAAPHHDTAWCRMPTKAWHHKFRSKDGTSDFLDMIRCDRIRVHRHHGPWNGKIQMVNAPIRYWCPGDIVHQIDVDEFWTSEQLGRIVDLQADHMMDSAYYGCEYLVGPCLRIVNRVPPRANEVGWNRTFRFDGRPWTTHEPPRLGHRRFVLDATLTSGYGLHFVHAAYVTDAQVAFKAHYYDRSWMLEGWRRLQTHTCFPAKLRPFWPDYPQAVVDRWNNCERFWEL